MKSMERILFVNATVRPESRTLQLAREVLKHFPGPVEELRLKEEKIFPLCEATLRARESFVQAGDYSDSNFRYAKQFAEADIVLIAAPYWDLSFPALLKIYLETVSVLGLTFCYTKDGSIKGLCRAKRLYYVTTAGGVIGDFHLGYDYVKALAQRLFGIPDVRCIQAECLDIVGQNPKEIMEYAKQHIQIESER